MFAHVDWLSFSFPVATNENTQAHEMGAAVGAALFLLDAGLLTALGLDDDVEPRSGRRPYAIGWVSKKSGVCVFCHPRLPHALIEVPGKACEYLYQTGVMSGVMSAVQHRVTRLDVAVDIETVTDPLEFSTARPEGRFSASGYVTSETGTTCYVGSQKSDRYARVYRYNEPHERAHLLRVEMVLRGQNARLGTRDILTDGIAKYAAMLGNTYGWQHPDWQPLIATDEKPETHRPERAAGKTLYWLADTIAPLLIRLHREGELNVVDFFLRYVVSEMSDEEKEGVIDALLGS